MKRCDWASCHRPAVLALDGWWHCSPHVQEHKALTSDQRRVAAVESRAEYDKRPEKVTELHGKGYTDSEIGLALHISTDSAKYARKSLGLKSNTPPRRKVALCGTRSGFQRHKSAGQVPCENCIIAEREYQRVRARARRAARRDAA